jgi:hypothetical protein
MPGITVGAVDSEDIEIEIEGMFRRSGLFRVSIRTGLHIRIWNNADEDLKAILDVKVLDSEGKDLIPTWPSWIDPLFPQSYNIKSGWPRGIGFDVEKGFGSVTIIVTLKDREDNSVIKSETIEAFRIWYFVKL